MKKIVLALALVAAAGTAQAKDPYTGPVLNGYNTGTGGEVTQALSTLSVDVTGIFSIDPYGDVLNVVNSYNIGAGSHVVGIGWDVSLLADNPSWLSELTVAFEDSGQTTGIFLTPGVGDDFPGTGTYTSGGVIDLVGIALDFNVGPDGLLRLEYFEGFDDFADDWDGIWESGFLTVQYEPVPAPGAAALLVGGGLLALRRRR